MGYTQHRFFIVHSWDAGVINDARQLALETFEPRLIGPVMTGVINDANGFIVWTSGSKLGWTEDDAHRFRIDALIEKLSKMERPPRWVRVDDGEEIGDLSAEHGSDGNYEHKYERYSTSSEDEP
jgi:hypothetical protein